MVSIEEAFNLLGKAESEKQVAADSKDINESRAHMKAAFYSLFEAVKMANIIFNSRIKKGYMARGGTNTWAQEEFDSMASALSKEYYARGNFEGDGEREYAIWSKRCRDYIDRVVRQMRSEWSM